MMKSFLRYLSRASALIAATATFFTAMPAQAQGDLLVAPTRVILDGRRGTEIILSNIGGEEATYRIGLELRRMMPDGSLIDIDLANANEKESAALGMIRYAPRRITLPPGQPQSVRIAARPGAELPDGEYRAHLSFRAIPKPKPVGEEPAESATGISFKLVPIYGITIPVIIRHGKVEAQVALNQPKVVQSESGPQLHFNMTRQGQSSVYGELRVTKRGSSEPIYMIRGLAIYPELQGRSVKLPLTPEQAAAMKGQLRFEFREMPEAGGDMIAAVDAVLG